MLPIFFINFELFVEFFRLRFDIKKFFMISVFFALIDSLYPWWWYMTCSHFDIYARFSVTLVYQENTPVTKLLNEFIWGARGPIKTSTSHNMIGSHIWNYHYLYQHHYCIKCEQYKIVRGWISHSKETSVLFRFLAVLIFKTFGRHQMSTETGNKIDNGTFRYSPPWAKKAFLKLVWLFSRWLDNMTPGDCFGHRGDIFMAQSPDSVLQHLWQGSPWQSLSFSEFPNVKPRNFLWFPKLFSVQVDVCGWSCGGLSLLLLLLLRGLPILLLLLQHPLLLR